MKRLCRSNIRKHVNPIATYAAIQGIRTIGRKLGPFPAPPWRCHNPLAPHRGEWVVVDLDATGRTGRFTCSCGYVYTRNVNLEGKLSAPRARRWGPLLPMFVAWAHPRGAGITSAIRCIGTTYKTVRDAADEMGLGPWPRRKGVELSMADFHDHLAATKRNEPYFTTKPLHVARSDGK